MSPTRRASSVAGLRRAVEPIPTPQPPTPAAPAPGGGETVQKPARVTLNLPPELYRELDRWTTTTADALGVPRVSIQNAPRAMIRASIHDPNAEAAVLAQLRQQDGDH
jgi:hypothetical protein